MAGRALFLALIACLALLPACGSARQAGADAAPAPADLAADAVATLLAEGSAHYLIEVKADFEGGEPGMAGPYGFRLEGDASLEAFTGEGSATFAGVTFDGRLIAGPHEFFVNFMGQWYGTTDFGLADAMKELEESDEKAAELWRDLQTGDGVRRYFDRAFTGEVSEGPELDGQATWEFEGTLDAEGFVGLAEEFGEDEDREVLEMIARGTRLTFITGREDLLPRRLELVTEISGEDLEEAGADDFGPVDSFSFVLTVELSEFGKSVAYEAPQDFQPLENAFEGFFGGIG